MVSIVLVINILYALLLRCTDKCLAGDPAERKLYRWGEGGESTCSAASNYKLQASQHHDDQGQPLLSLWWAEHWDTLGITFHYYNNWILAWRIFWGCFPLYKCLYCCILYINLIKEISVWYIENWTDILKIHCFNKKSSPEMFIWISGSKYPCI